MSYTPTLETVRRKMAGAPDQEIKALFAADEMQVVLCALQDAQAALAASEHWQEEARRYATNADHWREKYETSERTLERAKQICKEEAESGEATYRAYDWRECAKFIGRKIAALASPGSPQE